MPKHRTAFLVTIQTNEPVKATSLAKTIRAALGGIKVWYGEPAVGRV